MVSSANYLPTVNLTILRLEWYYDDVVRPVARVLNTLFIEMTENYAKIICW